MYFSVKKLSVEVAKALRERFLTICSLAGTWGGGLTCFLIIICTNGANYNLLIQSHSFIYSIILWLFVTPILMQNVGFDKKYKRYVFVDKIGSYVLRTIVVMLYGLLFF